MKRFITIFIAISFCLSANIFGQVVGKTGVSMDKMVEIVKAEDELRYDKTLENFMKDSNPMLRRRAALAAGRIGDEKALPMLEKLLAKDSEDVRSMAAFAIGEIESIKAADAILAVLNNLKDAEKVRAKAIEAAGKIVAANNSPNGNSEPPKPENRKSKLLKKTILDNLNFEARKRSRPSDDIVLQGVTAALRAKPKDADLTLEMFLGYSNWLIRANTLNTLARLRSKNVNKKAKELLNKDKHPIVRANAARVLGAAGDKTAIGPIMNAALTDKDLRVRVNAIRALSGLKEAKTADKLLERSEKLFAKYKKSKYENPPVENELLTLASALGNILKGTDNARAVKFLVEFLKAEKFESPEIEVAFAKISPKKFVDKRKIPRIVADSKLDKAISDDDVSVKLLSYKWKPIASWTQGINEIASLSEKKTENIELRQKAEGKLRIILDRKNLVKASINPDSITMALSNLLSSFAKFKPNDLNVILRQYLKHYDVVVRSTAANLLGEVKAKNAEDSRRIYRELSNAFYEARKDKLNDAALAILDALEKQYKMRPSQRVKFPYMSPFISGMKSPDYLIRRKAAKIYEGFNIRKPDPMTVGNPDFKPFEVPKDINVLKFWDEKDKYGAKSRVKRADYKKALSRKNGMWGAILKTDKGDIRIYFFPEEAPLTVDNFLRLAWSGYFNGLAIHRVVPNFVVQDGDPRGDGSGGPGWQIRCEINQIPYERGTVGMALAGKDTGGSQWFVAHSPQPHLDGGYTVFGKVNETDMKIVDNLARGDKINEVVIIGAAPQKAH